MKAVRFRFVSIMNFLWIGIYVFRTFTIPPIYDFSPKNFDGRTLVKYMANVSQGASHCFHFEEDLTFIFQRRWLVGRILWMSLN